MDNNDYKSALEELLSQIREKSIEAELDIRRVIAQGTISDADKDGKKQSSILPLTTREAYLLAVRLVLCCVDPILMFDRISHTLELNGNISPNIQWLSDYVSDDPSKKKPVVNPLLCNQLLRDSTLTDELCTSIGTPIRPSHLLS